MDLASKAHRSYLRSVVFSVNHFRSYKKPKITSKGMTDDTRCHRLDKLSQIAQDLCQICQIRIHTKCSRSRLVTEVMYMRAKTDKMPLISRIVSQVTHNICEAVCQGLDDVTLRARTVSWTTDRHPIDIMQDLCSLHVEDLALQKA